MANLKDVKPPRQTMILGGKERSLIFDLNAFAEVEKRYGTVQEGMKKLQEGKMKDVRAFLWMGLIHEEAVLDEDGEVVSYNITPYQVGGWISDPDKLAEIGALLGAAMATSSPDPKNLAPAKGSKSKIKNTQGPVPVAAEGEFQVATVVLTEEEKAEEAKNV